MKAYTTERAAIRRVNSVIRLYGAWPCVIRDGKGKYRLSYDPDDE